MTGLAPSALLLGMLAAIAAAFAVRRTWVNGTVADMQMATYWTLALIVLQATHFTEELSTGFHTLFPALFGRPDIPLPAFVLINLILIVLWLACLGGIAARKRRVLFPFWFLCIAGIANMIAHPAFAVVSGGYFPGLWTSPILGIVAIMTCRKLLHLTEPA